MGATHLERIYSAMYPHLTRYKTGQIDLLELLTEWERILGISKGEKEQDKAEKSALCS